MKIKNLVVKRFLPVAVALTMTGYDTLVVQASEFVSRQERNEQTVTTTFVDNFFDEQVIDDSNQFNVKTVVGIFNPKTDTMKELLPVAVSEMLKTDDLLTSDSDKIVDGDSGLSVEKSDDTETIHIKNQNNSDGLNREIIIESSKKNGDVFYFNMDDTKYKRHFHLSYFPSDGTEKIVIGKENSSDLEFTSSLSDGKVEDFIKNIVKIYNSDDSEVELLSDEIIIDSKNKDLINKAYGDTSIREREKRVDETSKLFKNYIVNKYGSDEIVSDEVKTLLDEVNYHNSYMKDMGKVCLMHMVDDDFLNVNKISDSYFIFGSIDEENYVSMNSLSGQNYSYDEFEISNNKYRLRYDASFTWDGKNESVLKLVIDDLEVVYQPQISHLEVSGIADDKIICSVPKDKNADIAKVLIDDYENEATKSNLMEQLKEKTGVDIISKSKIKVLTLE